MTKPALNEAHRLGSAGTANSGSRSKRANQAFDERGRTIPWMARTLHRLYNGHAQKILDEEKVTIAHWIYLRVLAERGELNQLELSKRVGMASTTAVPALDSMEKRGLLKRKRDPKDRRKYYVGLTDKGPVFGRQATAEDWGHDCRLARRYRCGRHTCLLEGLASYCKKSG